MKVLIVEDSSYKLSEVLSLLNLQGITTYDAALSTNKGIMYATKNSYDLLITDLGLPIRDDEPVESPLEGLNMLEILAYSGILIPTIINSTTRVFNAKLEALMENDFPYLGQATNSAELQTLIAKFLTNNKRDDSNLKAL